MPQRFAELGAKQAHFAGDLKAVAALPEADPEALRDLKAAIGDRPVWIAASTHEGEEALAWRVHQELAAKLPDLLSVIVPRHPVRGDDVAHDLEASGATVVRRSSGTMPDKNCDVILGDTMGEMGLYLQLGPIVFIGKSLLHDGGHNPREPARLGRAIVFGPGMTNFVDAAAALTVGGGAIEVDDEAGLVDAVADLFDDSDRRHAMGEAALAIAERDANGVLDRVEESLTPITDALGHADP